MKKPKIATSQLNKSALAIEDAQTDIRLVVKNGVLGSKPKPVIEKKIKQIIKTATKQIKLERLASDAKESLYTFANRQYYLWLSLGISLTALTFLSAEASKGFPYKKAPTIGVEMEVAEELAKFTPTPETAVKTKITPSYFTDEKGVPLSTYYKEVWEDKVKPTLDRIADEVALDTHDYTGRNSLRNLAEMEVRYNDHLESIDELTRKGVKLVVASSHADCSDRCAEWQGRVYSLDGSYGVTPEGHKYVPLEIATDIYYTTKAGRVYKNGLLGFNCRHKISEYKGELLPVVSAKVRKEEYAITVRQRELERRVRRKKVEALMLKGINKEGYIKAKTEATALYNKYKRYCKENERAYYPMRVEI